jgi:pyruvate dehydrogenase E2 component (dihydrolipoamide acetyltransferase)
MAEYIVMPKLGFDMREAELVSWLKEEGDPVEKGEIVAEIESDKATLELEAQASGTLLKKLEDVGASFPSAPTSPSSARKAKISAAWLAMTGAAPPAEAAEPKKLPLSGRRRPGCRSRSCPGRSEAQAEQAEEAAPSAPRSATSSPAACARLRWPGAWPKSTSVDLARIEGSGPGGRIRKADVEAFLEAGPPAGSSPSPRRLPPRNQPRLPGPDTEVKTSRMRQAIARRMVESKTTVPHFYVTSAVDMDAGARFA